MSIHVEGFYLDFESRYWLALEAVTMRYEEREEFISDDDLLDIAIDWTPGWHYGLDDLPEKIVRERDALLEALYAAISD